MRALSCGKFATPTGSRPFCAHNRCPSTSVGLDLIDGDGQGPMKSAGATFQPNREQVMVSHVSMMSVS